MSTNAFACVPAPVNEPVKGYAPGSPERESLRLRLTEIAAERLDIPCIIGGKDVRTGRTATAVMPHDHSHVLADVHLAGPDEMQAAIEAAGEAWQSWSRLPWEERLAVFLKAAELLTGPWRDTLNAVTMLNQSKTCHQAEIDAAVELIDFWRFNPVFAAQLYGQQPVSTSAYWDRVDYRPLEGFVYAVTPFNFTSIAGNLPTSPAMMGCSAVWKPASTATVSAYFVMRLLQEAGLPDGVINLVYGKGSEVGDIPLADARLAGVHFTGSTAVFQGMWRQIGANIGSYANYPRIVGETGGKDFIVAHESCDVDELVASTVRGAFEYQGQKCSAASRLFVPDSIWPAVRERLVAAVESIKMGDVRDFSNYMGAVIDAASFATQKQAIDDAKADPSCRIVVGGGCDDSVGYFVEPTIIETSDPDFRTLKEELFGPVLTVFVYPARDWDATLRMVDTATPYGLTGAVFAGDRYAVVQALDALRHAAGNFYVNDKPTGAIVGQQPFGGSRASGTNDKAGSIWNLIRWTTPRTIKEQFVPPKHYGYPFLTHEG
jgi:1-pyrroline-5-carboxylate dehydrogenase